MTGNRRLNEDFSFSSNIREFPSPIREKPLAERRIIRTFATENNNKRNINYKKPYHYEKIYYSNRRSDEQLLYNG